MTHYFGWTQASLAWALSIWFSYRLFAIEHSVFTFYLIYSCCRAIANLWWTDFENQRTPTSAWPTDIYLSICFLSTQAIEFIVTSIFGIEFFHFSLPSYENIISRKSSVAMSTQIPTFKTQFLFFVFDIQRQTSISSNTKKLVMFLYEALELLETFNR